MQDSRSRYTSEEWWKSSEHLKEIRRSINKSNQIIITITIITGKKIGPITELISLFKFFKNIFN
jgi:hypothetical protein